MTGRAMRTAIAALALTALSACSSLEGSKPQPAGQLPPDVGNGVGSQYGNYEMRAAGETKDAAGNRCIVFNWDRPLNKDTAIRYSSLSCESKEHPVWMTTTPYTRKVIALSQSNLKGEQDPSAPPAAP